MFCLTDDPTGHHARTNKKKPNALKQEFKSDSRPFFEVNRLFMACL